jgi:hypothetical protein
LFPALEEQLGPLSDKHRQLAAVLSMIEIEALVGSWSGGVGRPGKHRRAIARSFIAKAVFNLNAARQLLDRLSDDVCLRRLCGWESQGEIPHESQFSRAFAEFAASELPQRLHEALIHAAQQERLIGHISRDSTEIEGREKPVRTPVVVAAVKPLRKRGRPKKGEQPPPPEPTRLEHQAAMTLEQMLDDLPRACNVGSKKNSKGYKETWVGYKLHLGNLCAGARFCSGATSDDFLILNQFLSEDVGCWLSVWPREAVFLAPGDTTPFEGPTGCGAGIGSPARRPRRAIGGFSGCPDSAPW